MDFSIREKRFSLIGAFIGILLLALHATALWQFWYWKFPPFDYATHFLGGAFVCIGLLRFFSRWIGFSRRRVFVVGLLLSFIIGVGWEILEFVAGIAGGREGYMIDTVIDLSMDLYGAVVMCFFVGRDFISTVRPVEQKIPE